MGDGYRYDEIQAQQDEIRRQQDEQARALELQRLQEQQAAQRAQERGRTLGDLMAGDRKSVV